MDVRKVAIQAGSGGWVCGFASDAPGPVWVRYERGANGRPRVAEVHAAFDREDGTPTRWRELANVLSSIEAEVAADPALLNPPTLPPTDGKDVRATLEGHAVRRRPRAPSYQELSADLTVEVPSTKPYPSDFYEAVATAYRTALLLDSAPARRIAEANGVPVKTVHGWVAAARKHGTLPPARPGRAG